MLLVLVVLLLLIVQKLVHGNSVTATSASKCTGNSATANKLVTPRNIALTGAVKGNAKFDGSADITINTTQNNIFILSGNMVLNASSNPGTYKVTTKKISYPSGFNKDNCTPINFSGRYYTDKGWASYQDANQSTDSMLIATDGRSLVLDDDGISIRGYCNSSSNKTLYYKIVLLKIN